MVPPTPWYIKVPCDVTLVFDNDVDSLYEWLQVFCMANHRCEKAGWKLSVCELTMIIASNSSDLRS